MAQVEIISEQERQGGWNFEAQILDDSGRLSRHAISLAWADYNLWSSDGSDEPSKVIEAVLNFMLSRSSADAISGRFDASITRRQFSDADKVIPRLIGR